MEENAAKGEVAGLIRANWGLFLDTVMRYNLHRLHVGGNKACTPEEAFNCHYDDKVRKGKV